ncbi:ComF family protein [Hohaiivirga grylli]
MAEPPVYGRARSACRYEGLARHLVYALKYGDKPEYAKIMGRMMHTAGRELIDQCDLIIPIPMHRRRLFHRHYNQAVILANTISQISGCQSSASALRRIRPTQAQSFLNKAQRRKNLKRAFAVAQKEAPMIKGARILLVDDVLTSGATADSAANVLLHTGASAVDILTFARVVKNYI